MAITLRKLTLTYDSPEDRIQMRSEADGGRIVTMWLSFRMCREIVKTLVRHLEAVQIARTPVSQNAMVQQSLHGQAKANLKQSGPVRSAGDDSFLLTKLSVQATDKRVLLKIPLPESDLAVIPLTVEEARQWLEILFQQYKKAEWPLELWPDWIRNNSAAAVEQTSKSVH